MNLKEKAELIRKANQLEEAYTMALQDPSDLPRIVGELRAVACDVFVGEIIRTYAKKRQDNDVAISSSFPVPSIEQMTENKDGSVSFVQAYNIQWRKSEPQSAETVHTYYFGKKDRKIIAEEGAGRMFAGDRD